MAEVLLFHHALGLTPGCVAFANRLRSAGHVVHTPDLYDGKVFSHLAEGVGYARTTGFETIIERGKLAAEALPSGLVYAGFSLGVLPAQAQAQNRPGARGALFFHSAIPISEFGGTWPPGVPLQIHTMEHDAEGDVDVARELASTVEGAELFLYPGDRHLFTDESIPDYDEAATNLVMSRVLAFLAAI